MEERKQIAIRSLHAIHRILEREGMTQTALASQLGCKDAKFTEIMKGRMLVPTEIMSMLCEKFRVSPDYLLLGEGEEFVTRGKSTPVQDNQGRLIPILPFTAAAGWMGGGNGADAFQGEQIAFTDFSDRGADCAIRVEGDSMRPRYNNGDILAIRILDSPSFFQWGKVYVLNTAQGCVIKKLFPDPDDEDKIICHSENCENYPDYKIPKDEVLGIAIVVGHAGVE